MMKNLALLVFTILTASVYSQNLKKIYKALWFDVIYMDASNNYQRTPEGDFIYHESLTTKGDTTGVSTQREYIMFRDDITFSDKKESFKLFKKEYVTNQDYEDFIAWVRDSLIMEAVYLNQNPTGNDAIPEELIGDMLDHPDVYYDEVNETWTDFDPSQPYINRQLFPFSWKMKGIKDYQIIPCISHLYHRPASRFYKMKEYNENKWYFNMNTGYPLGDPKPILITPDYDAWALESEHIFDLRYNLANHYRKTYPYYPVTGLLGTQIDAYLMYIEQEIQDQLNKKKINYEVDVTLPTYEELMEFNPNYDNSPPTFTTFDYLELTEQWQITNAEYSEFIAWVEDSIIREIVYQFYENEEVTGDMLEHDDVYFDEVNLSWTEFDCSQPFINRQLFHFKQLKDWQKPLDQEMLNQVWKNNIPDGKIPKHKLVYTFYWQDLKRKANPGDLRWNKEEQKYEGPDKDGWDWREVDMSYYTKKDKAFDTGVRRNYNRYDFIFREAVWIYPGYNCRECNYECNHEFGKGHLYPENMCKKCLEDPKEIKPGEYDFTSNPEGLVQGLNYYQALAYYNWKYHRHSIISASPLRVFKDLIPSEEEFERAQKGESFTHGMQVVEFPSPVFRYVIHFYEKEA